MKNDLCNPSLYQFAISLWARGRGQWNHTTTHLMKIVINIHLQHFPYDVPTTSSTSDTKLSLVIFLTKWFTISKMKIKILWLLLLPDTHNVILAFFQWQVMTGKSNSCKSWHYPFLPCVCSTLVFLERIIKRPTYDNKVYDNLCLTINLCACWLDQIRYHYQSFYFNLSTLLSPNLPMYSPASKQPHLEQVKHHKCHCFSKANNDWPLRMSSPHPAHSKHKQECERLSLMSLILFGITV